MSDKQTVKTAPWDAADYLDSPEAIAAYLDAAVEEAAAIASSPGAAHGAAAAAPFTGGGATLAADVGASGTPRGEGQRGGREPNHCCHGKTEGGGATRDFPGVTRGRRLRACTPGRAILLRHWPESEADGVRVSTLAHRRGARKQQAPPRAPALPRSVCDTL